MRRALDAVLSTEFGHILHTEREVHRGGAELAAARAPRSLQRFRAQLKSCVRCPMRGSERPEAASEAESAAESAFHRFRPLEPHEARSASWRH